MVQEEEQKGALAGGSQSHSVLPAVWNPACVKPDLSKTPCPHTRAHLRFCVPACEGRDLRELRGFCRRGYLHAMRPARSVALRASLEEVEGGSGQRFVGARLFSSITS